MTTPILSPKGEQAWLRFHQHMSWSDHFALGFLFCDDHRVADLFRERLADIYRARISRLQQLTPDTAAALDDLLLHRLLNPAIRDQALDAPYWLDLAIQSDVIGQRASANFLMRLNEQREKLRHNLTRPLVIVLPISLRQKLRELAPDLWAIRNITLDCDSSFLDETARTSIDPHDRPALPHSLTDAHKASINTWHDLQKSGTMERQRLLACAAAVDAYCEAHDYTQAYTAALELLCMARARNTDETLESLRDLSVSLKKAGNILLAQGKLEQAAQAYEESLKIARNLVTRIGETPESLRDLFVSLDKTGDILLAQGKLEQAAQAYEESLKIARNLVARIGETPESLRDLFVSLDKTGDTLLAQGKLEQAAQACEESLKIARNLVIRIDETPESLHDLSVSLNKVGNTLLAQGKLEQAAQAYEEGLQIARNLVTRIGETPESLRDLFVSLDKIGNTLLAQGKLEQAAQAYEEGLQIARNLVTHIGKTPESLRDLSISLDKVGRALLAQGRRDDANTMFTEALSIAQSLQNKFPHQYDYDELVPYLEQKLQPEIGDEGSRSRQDGGQ
jgi:tetratricopeptide (TPR) repeat protein